MKATYPGRAIQNVLLGDIGGTNARVALLAAPRSSLQMEVEGIG